MSFRANQERAKANSRRLVLLFIAVLSATVLSVNVLVDLVWRFQFAGFGLPPHFHLANTLFTLLVIFAGWLASAIALRTGGAEVARMIGAQEVFRANPGPYGRLVNIVDETALAARVRKPRVFVIDDDAINACAAGWDIRDSVICVTRGAIDRLTRSELQGVVAHEFSHILQGDVRLNMRLISLTNGLEGVSHLGFKLLQPFQSGRDRRGGGLFFIGGALILAGSIGWLAGRFLQAAVSRQREFLADAGATQYTRSVDGLGGALRKIGHQQHVEGISVSLPVGTANLVAHMMLSEPGEPGRIARLVPRGWFSSHPSLQDRLERLYGRRMRWVDASPLPEEGVAATPRTAPHPSIRI